MGLLIVLLVIVAAVAGVLWQVLEFAFWVAAVIFIAGVVVALAAFGWFRKRLSGRSGESPR
jgi:membrane protein implicated in regulation of membrane protease activity